MTGMGPDQGVRDWVHQRARQALEALRRGLWTLDADARNPKLAAPPLPPDGQMLVTRRTLDLALGGPGFFLVETPDGLAGTRFGRFFLKNDGALQTAEGLQLQTGFRVPAGARQLVLLNGGEAVAGLEGGGFAVLGSLWVGLPDGNRPGGWAVFYPGEAGVGPLLQGALEMPSRLPSGKGIHDERARFVRPLEEHRNFRQPAAGGACHSPGSMPHAPREEISSQQIASLVRKLRVEALPEEHEDAEAGALMAELVRLAVNRLNSRQAAELRRTLDSRPES